MVLLAYSLVVVLSYLLGSVPSGFLAGKMRGIDIRKAGSGNIGATNVFRILGKWAGTGVLMMDALKGWLAVTVVAELVALGFGPPTMTPEAAPSLHGLQLAAGLAAILGHNYTCWLKFKGGKGIATSAGVLVALVPWALLIILSIWIMLFAVTRIVSVGSLAAAFTLPFASWFTTKNWTLTLVTGAMGALAIYKHKANIQRLLAGTESRVGGKRREAPPVVEAAK